jgi:hypothetical protein
MGVPVVRVHVLANASTIGLAGVRTLHQTLEFAPWFVAPEEIELIRTKPPRSMQVSMTLVLKV